MHMITSMSKQKKPDHTQVAGLMFYKAIGEPLPENLRSFESGAKKVKSPLAPRKKRKAKK